MTNFPCKCGHAKIDHNEYGGFCWHIREDNYYGDFKPKWVKFEDFNCSCFHYCADNLRYLEQLSE